MEASHRNGSQDQEEAESILRSLTRSFDQVNIATEFFLLKKEPGSVGPELQLACLIKDRIARIEEQVTELYQILNRPRHTEHHVTTH